MEKAKKKSYEFKEIFDIHIIAGKAFFIMNIHNLIAFDVNLILFMITHETLQHYRFMLFHNSPFYVYMENNERKILFCCSNKKAIF